jgi:hypothetical protein
MGYWLEEKTVKAGWLDRVNAMAKEPRFLGDTAYLEYIVRCLEEGPGTMKINNLQGEPIEVPVPDKAEWVPILLSLLR